MPERSPEFAEVLRDFEDRCRRAGFQLTVQRRVILEAMLLRNDHPTAEEIFDSVRARVPEISRGTVYRTLDSLVQLGTIRRAHHPGSVVRFDSNTRHHHHLVCLRCHHMADLEDARLDNLPQPDRKRTGFRITDYSVHFTGLCAECQAADEAAGSTEAWN
ncbi:MAG TPA: transcriptional repressor [Geminicoccaceae bacterium]